MSKTVNKDPAFQRALQDYMTQHQISIVTEFAQLLGVPRPTLQGWLHRAQKPGDSRKKIILSLLQMSPEGIRNRASDSVDVDTESDEECDGSGYASYSAAKEIGFDLACSQIDKTRQMLNKFVDGSREDRIELRRRLGDQFELFLNAVRAMTSERARDTILREKGGR